MLPRALEVLLVALLVVLTVAAVFSFMNHQHQLENQRLLRQMVGELKTQRESTQALSQVIAALQGKATAPTLAAVTSAPPHTPATSPPRNPVVEVRSPIAVAALPAPPAPRPPPAAVPETKVPNPPKPVVTEIAKKPAVAPPATLPKPGTPEVAVAVVPPPAAPKTPKPAPPTVAPATPIPPKTPSVPVAAPSSAGSKAYEGNWKRDEPVVRQVIEQLLGGRYQSVVRRFDRTLASELPQADLAAVIDPIRFKHLGMKQILGHQAVPHTLGANTNVYEVAAEMSDGHRLVFTITLDQNQRITGLIMK